MTIGKVVVRPTQRTTIASPTFSPRMNVAIEDIQNMNVVSKNDGDVLVYDALSGEFKASPVNGAAIKLDTVNGGSF